MQFSIVTPSFRNSQWLKLCIASVADQQGVAVEHIVQDAGSDDGTLDWLPKDSRVTAYIEKDNGMYDAINRGFKRAKGEILAYLNCDEQYLPGALKTVGDFFEVHSQIDVVFASTVIVDAEGEYICHRRALMPLKHHLWYRFPILSCAIFLRRRVLDEQGIHLDSKWRDIADNFWVMDMVGHHLRMAVLRHFTSVFTETGENMNLKANGRRESQMKLAMAPLWVKKSRPLIILHHRLRCLLNGHYFQKPFEYSIYTPRKPDERTVFRVEHPTALWRGRVESRFFPAEL